MHLHWIAGWVFDVSMKDRIPVLREPVLRNLSMFSSLSVLFDTWGSSSEMDDDTNAAFRKGPPGCQDILISLFYVLKSDMIVKILASIRQQSNVAESESALFVMSSIGRDVLKFLKQVRDAKPRNTAKGRRAALQDVRGVRARSARISII